MGLREKLFKPSPEKLKDREDAKRCINLIANKEWDQLVEIGKPAVKPLIFCLSKTKYKDLVAPIADTLGRIGDVRAIKPLLSLNLFDIDDVKHDKMNWSYYEHRMPAVAKALANIGEPAVEKLIKGIKDVHLSLLRGIPIVWALCKIGNRKSAETVVNWIFLQGQMAPIVPGTLGKPLFYQEKFLSPPDLIRSLIPSNVMTGLLGDYHNLILDIFAWQLVSYSEATDRVQFNLSRCSEAMQRICEIETPVSSNILHKLSKIDHVTFGFQKGGAQSLREYIDFKQYQQMSKNELIRRGNPYYDSSVYYDEEAWKLK